MKRTLSTLVLVLLLVTMLTVSSNLQSVKASGIVYIRADGSIDPPTAPIQRDGDTYTFTANITDSSIAVERSNIIIDGAGYTLQGTNAYAYGILLSGRSNVTIKNTNIESFGWGVYLDYSSYSSISGNNITANNYDGIRLFWSSNNSVSGNNNANNQHRGIHLFSSSNNSISGNNITANNEGGIVLDSFEYSTNYNSISGNNITANNGHGIWLFSSSNNSVSGNNIANNQYEGIRLYSSSNNSISGNNITANNLNGIWFYSSSGNAIYHNNFVDNTRQVYIDGSKNYQNVWDNGYPSGGNYWSDYTGADEYAGPNQDEPGSDGIGDTLYVIDSNNMDRYPLTCPWQPKNDLELLDFSPVQVVYDASALVANKPAVFRAVVQNSFNEIKPLRIRFSYNSGSPIDVPEITIKANSKEEFFVPFGSSILPQKGTLTYSAEIDPDHKVPETDETNNMITGSKKVVETGALSVLYVPLRNSTDVPVSSEDMKKNEQNGDEYLLHTFPTTGVYSQISDPVILERNNVISLLWTLYSIDQSATEAGFDRTVVILPNDNGNWTYDTIGWPANPNSPGWTPNLGLGPWTICTVENTYWAAIPHELAHTYGRPGGNSEEYKTNPPGNTAAGYDASRRVEVDNGLCFMAATMPFEKLGDPMPKFVFDNVDYGAFLDGYWVCKDCYEALLGKFKKGVDPEIIHMGGIIFENDTVLLPTWSRIPDGVPSLPLGCSGDYQILFLNDTSSVIAQTGFNASFISMPDQFNLTAFSFTVEYPAQTRKIQILHNASVIAERQVTLHLPTVNLTSPNGGELLTAGEDCMISWSSSDLDSDQLSYNLFCSQDEGIHWVPVTGDLNQTNYEWDTSCLVSGTNYLVKVIASDGVNTGEDISDGTFTVLDSTPPIASIVSPQAKTYYSTLIPLTLGVDEATSWIGYSLDGQSNSTISGNTTINVGEGQHQIKLFANDTSGNMGSSEAIHFFVNSSAYSPWESSFTSLDGYPIASLAVHDGRLYAVANNRLYSYDNTSLSVVDGPAYLTSVESYSGRLVVGGQGGVYYLDGATLKLAFPVPTYIKTLGIYNNALYAGTFLDNSPTLYYCNGSVDNPSDWNIDTKFWDVLSFSGPFGSIDSFAEYNEIPYITSGGTIYSFNGTDWNVANTFDDVYSFSCTKVYNGKLYLATRDQGWRKPHYQGYSGFNGRVIEFDGENWTTVLDHDYWVYSLEVYDGKLNAGTANKILTYNGTDWETSFNATEGAYYAISMITYDGKICVGMGNGYIFADPAPLKAKQEDIVVSEFPSTTILAVFALTTPAVVLIKRKRLRDSTKPSTHPFSSISQSSLAC